MTRKSNEISDSLYERFVEQMRPYAEAQGVAVDELIERLEYRTSYDSESDPEFFPTQCICGETLVAQAFQFDDPESNYKRSYTLGCVCAKNLNREMKRLEVVKALGKYLCRPKSRQSESLPRTVCNDIDTSDLCSARVIGSDIKSKTVDLYKTAKHLYQRDTIFAEGVCVAYGMVPEKAILTYFLPDGSLW